MLCANVDLIRASEVAAVKSATLNAVDYYKPGVLVVVSPFVDSV